MDFELFESDDDDELLSAAYIEATKNTTYSQTASVDTAINIIPEFQCAGEDRVNSEFRDDGFIRNGFTSTKIKKNIGIEQISLTSYDFQALNLCTDSVAQYIFGEACKNIQFLLSYIRPGGSLFRGLESHTSCHSDSTYYQRRRQITLLYHILLDKTQVEQWALLTTHITRLRKLLNVCLNDKTWRTIYCVHSSKGNDSNLPDYHLLHGALEWRLLDLCLLHKYTIRNNISETKTTENKRLFIAQLERTIDDLLGCSAYHYSNKAKCTTDFQNSTSFPCTCFKEMWLVLLKLIEQKWSEAMETETTLPMPFTFWNLFNTAMARLELRMGNYEMQPLDFYQFGIWKIQMLTRLHGYDDSGEFQCNPTYKRNQATMAAHQHFNENYEFCDSYTQKFLNAQPKEDHLRTYICMLMPMLLYWWSPRVSIVILLWEYFHKRLNSSFNIVTGASSKLGIVSSSGNTYLKRYRALVDLKEQPVTYMHLSSYTLHTLLLGKTVQRLQTTVNGANQTKKLLGRIYSKFSEQKFLTLSETGIYHLIELFVVLCLCGDINELMPSLREKLLMVEYEKLTSNKQIAVAKGHMALLILHAEHKWDMRDYIAKLLYQLAAIRNDLAVAKIYADSLIDIFVKADDCGEHLLIDTWLPHLLNNSTPVEQERILEALHTVFEQVQARKVFNFTNSSNSTIVLLQAMHKHILPLLRIQFVNSYSVWLPQLVADFCLSVSDEQSFQKMLTYFCNTQPSNREAQPALLLRLLESPSRSAVPSVSVMQIWLKSLVMLTAKHKAVAALTTHIVCLPEYRFICGLPAEELLDKEPLCNFIATIGKRYESCTDYSERLQLADKLNAYVQNFDQWLQIDPKMEKNELTTRYYNFIAIVIFNCASLVYVKSKLNCFFHVAITRFVLPTHVLMGKPPEGKLSQLVHKIWPVVVQGIGRLSYKSDAYINKILNDLIQKWTPNFKISNNTKLVARPFIICLQSADQKLALYVFERLTSMFLATHRRQSNRNACLVITIFQEIIDTVTKPGETSNICSISQLVTFMKASTLPALEHIMMVDDIVPSRRMLLAVFKMLLQCQAFQVSNELQELFSENLRLLTKKHLSYFSFFYFELLMKLVPIAPHIINSHMDFLRAEVQVVEAKRCDGVDQRIRNCLEKLQKTINALTT